MTNEHKIELEEIYQDAMLATTMFDAPILEKALTALHSEVVRLRGDNDKLKAENAKLKLVLKIYESIGEKCIHCNGTGFVAGVLDEPCDNCAGEGYIKDE